uniref:NADH dehydrogenase subunit 1 n=1 Tax=Junco hyemalis TaxID=40217 RepID=A0A8C5JP84_JUNHY
MGELRNPSGFNTEYAARPLALFFLAEYANIMLMNTLTAILFFKPSLSTSLKSYSQLD